MALRDFEIGSTSSTTNVEELGTPLNPPRSTWNEYSAPTDLADGSVRGAGWKAVTWTWDFINILQRAQLKTFCSDKSATVYIRTLTLNTPYPTYEYVTGELVWPDGPEENTNGRIQNFILRFRALVTFTP